MSAHQGSGHLGHNLISHGLRGSQIALELQAVEQAQQEAAAAAEMTEAPLDMTRPAAANDAMLIGMPHQAADTGGQADTAYQQASATAAPDLHAPHFQTHGAGASYNPSIGPVLQQQREQQQLSAVQMPPQTSAVAIQPHTGDMYAPAGASSDDVNASSGMHSSQGQLASPDIGLKLGHAHSPGLSEDGLGGDQEFMDAMQAMAGQLHSLHAFEALCTCATMCTMLCLQASFVTISEQVYVVLCRSGALSAVGGGLSQPMSQAIV